MTLPLKFGVAFPIVYHTLGGFRHLVRASEHGVSQLVLLLTDSLTALPLRATACRFGTTRCAALTTSPRTPAARRCSRCPSQPRRRWQQQRCDDRRMTIAHDHSVTLILKYSKPPVVCVRCARARSCQALPPRPRCSRRRTADCEQTSGTVCSARREERGGGGSQRRVPC